MRTVIIEIMMLFIGLNYANSQTKPTVVTDNRKNDAGSNQGQSATGRTSIDNRNNGTNTSEQKKGGFWNVVPDKGNNGSSTTQGQSATGANSNNKVIDNRVSKPGQAITRGNFVYDPVSKSFKRGRPNGISANNLNASASAFVLALDNGIKAFNLAENAKDKWFTPSANQISDYSSKPKTKLYPISFGGYRAYPNYLSNGKSMTAPAKNLALNNISENVEHIYDNVAKNLKLEANPGKFTVYYFNKLALGYIVFPKSDDFVIVTDTLYMKQPKAGFENAIVGVNNDKRAYTRIIANTVIYEGPTVISMANDADVDLRIKQAFLKTSFENLNSNQLKGMPIATGNVLNNGGNNMYLSGFQTEDKSLINRLYVKQMNQLMDEFNITADPWQMDKKLERFQTIRYQKMNPEVFALDPSSQSKFSSLCSNFDSKYKNYAVKNIRKEGNVTILAEGNITKTPIEPIKFYALPSIAKLLVKMKDSSRVAFGTMTYNNTGTSNIILEMDVELGIAEADLKAVQETFQKKGINIESKLSSGIMTIKEQSLKLLGKASGKIIPISNNLLRLKVEVSDNSMDIINLINTSISFNLDYQVKGTNNIESREIKLVIDPAHLSTFKTNDTKSSFEILDRTVLTSEVQLVNNLNASANDNEGALDYVQVMVEFNFNGQLEPHGPYTLSPHNTTASTFKLPFLVKSNEYNVTVTGTAYYQNGKKDLTIKSDKSQIISIDDRAFQ